MRQAIDLRSGMGQEAVVCHCFCQGRYSRCHMEVSVFLFRPRCVWQAVIRGTHLRHWHRRQRFHSMKWGCIRAFFCSSRLELRVAHNRRKADGSVSTQMEPQGMSLLPAQFSLRRYSAKHSEVLSRRTQCSEQWLVDTIVKMRSSRQSSLGDERRKALRERTVRELVEFMSPRTAGIGEVRQFGIVQCFLFHEKSRAADL